MQIESIEPISKDRSRIKLDTGEDFVLYKGELRLLKLKEQSLLPEETYNTIMTLVLPKRAKLRAMNLLKVRPYTEYELHKKLKDGGYPEDVLMNALEYVKSYGYINDKQYAIDFIKSQTERRSKKELILKLQMKGIEKSDIEYAMDATYGGESDDCFETSFNEEEVVLKTLKKKGVTGEESYEEKQKLLAYFYRRGFDMDSVYRAYDSLRK